MALFTVSIVIALVGSMAYHVVIKLTPADVNPAVSLIATYGTSMVLCLGLLPLFPPKVGLVAAFRQLNWTSYALGASLVGLEAGFLLAYRAGWKLSVAALVVNAAATVLLVAVGLWLFRERLSAVNLLGIGLCLAGLVLINLKG